MSVARFGELGHRGLATASTADVVRTAVAGAVVLIGLALVHKELVLEAFDRPAATALGYPITALDIGMLLAVELTIVTSLPAMGTTLSVALVVAPAATARLWTDRVPSAMALAATLGATAGAAGLAVSARFDVAGGASIALTAGVLSAISFALRSSRSSAGSGQRRVSTAARRL